MKKNKFFKKIFLAYIIIIFAYTSIAAAVFFYKSNESNLYRVNNTQKIALQQFRDNADNSLRTAIKLINQFKKDSNVLRYARHDVPNYYNVTQIYNKLNQNFFYDLGFTIAITKLANDPVITSSRTSDFDQFLENSGLDMSDIESIKEYFNDTDLFYDSYYVLTDKLPKEGDTLTIVNRQSPPYASDIYFFISFYTNELFPELNNSLSEGFAIAKDGNVITASIGKKIDFQALFDSQLMSNLYQDKGISDDYGYAKPYDRIEQDNYTIHHIGSEVIKGWKYIYITPGDLSSNNLQSVLVFSVLFYIFLAILGLGVAFLAAKHLYKPIPNIVNILSSSNDSEIQGDELSFIEESAVKIKNANERLKETIHFNKLPLKIKFLSDILYGLVSTEMVEENLKKYNLEYLKDGTTVCIIEFTNYQSLYDSFSKSAILDIVDQILIIIKEQLQYVLEFEILELNYKRYALIVNEENQNLIRKLLHPVLSDIEASFELTMVAAVGQPVESIYHIEESFNDALTILENRILTDKKLTISLEDIPLTKDKSYFYPMDFERRLIQFVTNGQEEEALSTLERLLDKNLVNEQADKKILKSFVFAVIGTLNRIYQQLDMTNKERTQRAKQIYEKLSKGESTTKLKEEIIAIFEEIIFYVNSVTKQAEQSFADELIDYIHDNYNKDISLIDIAEEFNYSTAYISTLFKEQLNENYKDYLNNYRVKMSKEFMKKNKNLKIKDVAGMVGCNNVNTFIRMFKRYEGISPGKYISGL